jgi:glycosyltransferase involved in cell wall biosynthesis
MEQKTVLISINASWNIVNFRSGLVAALRRAGYRVAALAPADSHSARLVELGVDYRPIEMDTHGTSPLADLRLLWLYHRALRRLRPDVFLGFTAKPNIYGSLAAHALGIKVINNVSGLGTAFIRQGLLTRIVAGLYRLALRRSATVFFQNDEDRALFVAGGIVRPEQARLLPGSGVDLERFSPAAGRSGPSDGFTFLLAGRLLWDKGVGEFVEAARIVRKEEPGARFQLLGFLGAANPAAVAPGDVAAWAGEGLVEYLGETDDVRPFIAAANCVVLPSYREGLPRSLLEAAAMARPLIATDVPGCRQVVEHGANGFLCAPRDAPSLAKAMLEMLRLPPARVQAMGAAGRAKAELVYDEKLVSSRYLEAIGEALGPAG